MNAQWIYSDPRDFHDATSAVIVIHTWKNASKVNPFFVADPSGDSKYHAIKLPFINTFYVC